MNSNRSVVRERALGRIRKLIRLLTNKPKLQVQNKEPRPTDSPTSFEELQIPILGQLLGHLFVFPHSMARKKVLASETLYPLYDLLSNQESRSTARNEGEQIQNDLEDTTMVDWLSTRELCRRFAGHLHAVEKTDVVCVAINALKESSVLDKESARNVLDVAMSAPKCWLVDVPNIVKCIHGNVEGIKMESARQSMGDLLLLLTKKHLTEVVSVLMKIAPPSDSSAVPMWEMMFSDPQIIEKVLMEVFRWHQAKHDRILCMLPEDTGILQLMVLACKDFKNENLEELCKFWRFLRRPNPALHPLVLQGLMTLSQRAETARRMKILLPDMTEDLQDSNGDVIRKALVILQNMMDHLKKKETSSIAVQLLEKLLPLFHHELSQVREQAVRLFTRQLKCVMRNHKKMMTEKVRTALLPLFSHLCDPTPSVAKASQEGLLAAAKFLGWKLPEELVQAKLQWNTAECLMKQDKKRAEDYINQSLRYLDAPQDAVREAAVMFLAVAARPLKDTNPEKMAEIYRGKEGQGWVGRGWWDREWGSTMPGPAPGKPVRGSWGIPAQQLSSGWAWWDLEGMLGGLCRHRASSQLCFSPSQPFSPSKQTPQPQSVT
ncbi:uncharacterized protein LOC128850043 isoform X1 [Cuculus canorus]|uniref:uncharacterized protein LOC128850043 isoform X1 n=1 Tax=Cuculus canorus TaxID=55661 RepID=UPI0023AABAFF|nr:uncharacterized protein LOC128850043 isoform X1 [Cuculus canorus]